MKQPSPKSVKPKKEPLRHSVDREPIRPTVDKEHCAVPEAHLPHEGTTILPPPGASLSPYVVMSEILGPPRCKRRRF